MHIRTRLTLRFTALVAGLLLVAFVIIYFSQASYRRADFYRRLRTRALSTARLLVDVEEVDLRLLRVINKNSISLQQEQVVVYDYRNEEIFDSREGDPAYADFIVGRDTLNIIRLAHAYGWQRGSKEVFGITYTDNKNNFVVIATGYDYYGYGKLRNVLIILVAVWLGSILIILLLGYVFARQALRPISQVVDEVEGISASNLHARVQTGESKDEIGQLAQTFNRMLDRLEEAFKVQRSFVSNASHELRTPLTALSAQIEVTLMKPRSQEDYQKILLSLQDDMRQLIALTNGLLALAQSGLNEKALEMVRLRVDEILWGVRSDYMKRKPECIVEMDYGEMPDDEDQLCVFGNEQLLRTVFINLIDNACKFSPDKRVEVLMNFTESSISISFTDEGRGIPEDALSNILQPFYRGSNVSDVKGHGLGLALANKIISLHGGELKIDSEEGKGTVVEVELPVG